MTDFDTVSCPVLEGDLTFAMVHNFLNEIVLLEQSVKSLTSMIGLNFYNCSTS